MCLRFDSCFGVGSDHDDDDYRAPSAKGHATTAKAPHQPPPAQRNGHYHNAHGQHQQGVHHGAGHRASHHQTAAAADEADRKASNDAKRGAPAPAAVAGAAGAWGAHGYAAGAREKAYAYTGGPANKEDTVDYHYPTATAATTDHERY